MTHPIIATLKERRLELVGSMTGIAETAMQFKRDLSSGEEQRFEAAKSEVEQIDARIKELEGPEQRAKEIESAFARLAEKPKERAGGSAAGHPLAYTSQALDALQSAIESRTAGRFVAGEVEQRAALATTTFGAPRAWGANVLAGPRLLHVVAGVPQQSVDAAYAQHPKFTLPTASASVGENVTLAEFAASTAGSVTLARYGRWTDISREGGLGTDAGSIVAMHQLGVALDLDAALVDAVETAAGAAVAFTADVPAAIRTAMSNVLAATAAEDPEQLVILVNPANAALLQDVTPVGGQTVGERFQRFSGALVYPTSAANTGFMTVANLGAGCRYFEGRGLTTETDEAVKTATLTIATSVIAGYGVGLASGFAVMVDVVTP